MKITILAVGKVKEKYFTDAMAEYQKRLKPMVKLNLIEVPDESLQEGASPALVEKTIGKEGEYLLAKLPTDAYVIALAIEGKPLTSPQLATELELLAMKSCKDVVFVIGGSWGLSPQVLQRADLLLSFGALTYPHQLMRVMLLEQIYRAFKINRHEPYHK